MRAKSVNFDTVHLPEWARKHMVGQWVPVGKVWVGIVTISPESARHILDKHNEKKNRHIKDIGQVKLCRVLRAGQFRINYQTIQFDVDGDLRDGQNRLTACEKTGIPIEVLCVYGTPRDAFSTFDNGSLRSHGDALAIRGEENTIALAGTVAYYYHFLTSGKVYRVDAKARAGLSIDDTCDMVERHPKIRDSVHLVVSRRQIVRHMAGNAIPAALHYVFSQHDTGLADAFFLIFDKMAKGEIGTSDLPEEWHSIRLLYQIVQNNLAATRKLKPHTVSHLIVLAWNAVHACKPVKLLRVPSPLAPYPQIAGWTYDDESGLPTDPRPPSSLAAIPEIT